jgi:hypothetical protein
MALKPRAKWMAALIAHSFEGLDEYHSQDIFLNDYKEIMDTFMEGKGPASVFVFYQS